MPGESVERDLSWLDASYPADLSADGRRLLLYEGGVGGGARFSTYLRGTDGSPAVRLGDGEALALSPGGQWAITRPTSEAMHLDVVPTGAGQSRRLERAELRLRAAKWLADGRRVVVRAVGDDGRGRLNLLDVEGTAERAITPEDVAVGATGWAISPDGLRYRRGAG